MKGTKIYVEIPLSGNDLDLDLAREFASFLESAMDNYGRESGKWAGRTIGDVTVYKNGDDLKADLEEQG